MFGQRFPRANNVRLVMPASALEAVFNECDRFNVDETGGRVIGTYAQRSGQLIINVSGIIEPGPGARRSSTSFFQDGSFQERIFREIERAHPMIEHLGNWHTHHVNGFPHLSGGDVETYLRTVNHANHNTSFFYALLVTKKEASHSNRRYKVRHYVLRRGDSRVFEIDEGHVEITQDALLWPIEDVKKPSPSATPETQTLSTQDAAEARGHDAAEARGHDAAVLKDFYVRLRAFSSPKVGLFWRGPIELIDGSEAEVLVIEDASGKAVQYRIGMPQPPVTLKSVATDAGQRQFPSARTALIHMERACNRVLFEKGRRTS